MSARPAPAPSASVPPAADPMPLLGIDHVELWVGNAQQAAYFYERAFGFRRVGYRGLETGARDRTSYALHQGRVRLVLTGALGSGSPIAAHQRRHGDAVKVIALAVPDATHAHDEAVRRGARSVAAPRRVRDEHGTVALATIAAFGDTLHTFVTREAYDGPFLPGYAPLTTAGAASETDVLIGLDHVVGNVELGRMDEWVRFYERVFGMTQMRHFSDETISTEYSALMSKVMADGRGRIKLPINEPAAGRRRSQVDEFLEFHEGPGAQHLAVTTRDIVATVAELRRRGVEFLAIPDEYYDDVPARVPEVARRLDGLRAQGILVDRDDEGYLLQTFTKPVGDRPTLFWEVIERHGARGFGNGNFKALFEALEREQARRGNL
jgi:4-hydroxyphenylpyruvate dioxygenase